MEAFTGDNVKWVNYIQERECVYVCIVQESKENLKRYKSIVMRKLMNQTKASNPLSKSKRREKREIEKGGDKREYRREKKDVC